MGQIEKDDEENEKIQGLLIERTNGPGIWNGTMITYGTISRFRLAKGSVRSIVFF